MNWDMVIWAGVLATAVMTVVMYLGKAAGMQMDMSRMLARWSSSRRAPRLR
jgi:hypothetical protein